MKLLRRAIPWNVASVINKGSIYLLVVDGVDDDTVQFSVHFVFHFSSLSFCDFLFFSQWFVNCNLAGSLPAWLRQEGLLLAFWCMRPGVWWIHVFQWHAIFMFSIFFGFFYFSITLLFNIVILFANDKKKLTQSNKILYLLKLWQLKISSVTSYVCCW